MTSAHYPEAPGHRNIDTSTAAANANARRAPTLREGVFESLRHRPQTSIQLAASLGVRFESIQPRTSELRAMGLIEDSGARGPSRSDRLLAIVWRVVDKRPELAIGEQGSLF